MGFEGLYGKLCGIGGMNIGRNKLIGGLPVVGYGVAIVLACLVVKDLVRYNVVPFLKMSHDAAVC